MRSASSHRSVSSRKAQVSAWVLLIGLAGCGGDSASPTAEPAPAEPPAAIDAECDIDPAVFPEFESQEVDPITFHDQTGLAIGCRHIGSEEQTAILDTFGPPLPPGMTNESLYLRRADADGTRLLVMWVIAGCDAEARMVASRSGAGVLLTVTQRVVGECFPGTSLTTVEMAFRQAISPDDVTTSLVHQGAP